MTTEPSRSSTKTRSAVARVTWTGLIINILLSALKFACGVLGSSQAIVADAVHSLSDSSTDIAVLVGVRYWTRPPDRGHPHGHGRIETMVTSGIAGLLLVVAAGLVYNAVASLAEKHANPPGAIAAAAAGVSIVSKELLYRWTARVGRRAHSSAVVANAWHHRSDAFSSVPALLAVLGATWRPEWYFLDHVGAILVSVFIVRAAIDIARPALRELLDAGAPLDETEDIAAIAMSVEGVHEVHNIRTRYSGGRLQVDLHLLVPGDMTVRRGHDVADRVQERLRAEGPDLTDVIVHVEPYEESSRPEAKRGEPEQPVQ